MLGGKIVSDSADAVNLSRSFGAPPLAPYCFAQKLYIPATRGYLDDMSISFDDFKKVELKTAKILEANRVEGSEKLIQLLLDDGSKKEESDLPVSRQIVAGIGTKYEPEALIGKTIVIVANLEPRNLMGLESQGMLLAASNDEQGPILLTTMEEIEPGSEIR